MLMSLSRYHIVFVRLLILTLIVSYFIVTTASYNVDNKINRNAVSSLDADYPYNVTGVYRGNWWSNFNSETSYKRNLNTNTSKIDNDEKNRFCRIGSSDCNNNDQMVVASNSDFEIPNLQSLRYRMMGNSGQVVSLIITQPSRYRSIRADPNISPDSMSKSERSAKEDGAASFHLVHVPAHSARMRFIIQDGRHSSPRDYHGLLNGMYFWKQGEMFLASETTLPLVSYIIHNDGSENVSWAEDASAPSVVTIDPTFNSQTKPTPEANANNSLGLRLNLCDVKLHMKFAPLKPSIRARWSTLDLSKRFIALGSASSSTYSVEFDDAKEPSDSVGTITLESTSSSSSSDGLQPPIKVREDISEIHRYQRDLMKEEEAKDLSSVAEAELSVPAFATFSSLSCSDLNINANVTLLFRGNFQEAVNYTLMVSFTSFIQLLVTIKQIEFCSTQGRAMKVSFYMVAIQALMDSYLCLGHFWLGVVPYEILFNAFATIAFFKFVIFSIFEIRFMLMILRANQPNSMETWEMARSQLSLLYSRFYVCLILGIVLMYQFSAYIPFMIFIFYSFWVPQIILTALHGYTKPVLPLYVIGISLSRLLIPLYIFGYQHSFLQPLLQYEYRSIVCVLLSCWVLLQMTLVLVQHYFGPRVFVLSICLPPKYDYFRVPSDPEVAESDCVICMTALSEGEPMITPCEHVFHSRCLQQWMDIKMECPTCRRSLPAVD